MGCGVPQCSGEPFARALFNCAGVSGITKGLVCHHHLRSFLRIPEIAVRCTPHNKLGPQVFDDEAFTVIPATFYSVPENLLEIRQ